MCKSIQGICILILTLLIGLAPVLALAANPATETTARLNAAWFDTLDFDDESEKENALRGLIEAPESLVILDDAGKEVWNVADYAFVNELEAVPDTVNPSLFRNTLYNSYAGLFEVCDGIYQVRGYVQFAFLAIDYLTAGHAGLLQLAFTAIPISIITEGFSASCRRRMRRTPA